MRPEIPVDSPGMDYMTQILLREKIAVIQAAIQTVLAGVAPHRDEDLLKAAQGGVDDLMKIVRA